MECFVDYLLSNLNESQLVQFSMTAVNTDPSEPAWIVLASKVVRSIVAHWHGPAT